MKIPKNAISISGTKITLNVQKKAAILQINLDQMHDTVPAKIDFPGQVHPDRIRTEKSERNSTKSETSFPLKKREKKTKAKLIVQDLVRRSSRLEKLVVGQNPNTSIYTVDKLRHNEYRN